MQPDLDQVIKCVLSVGIVLLVMDPFDFKCSDAYGIRGLKKGGVTVLQRDNFPDEGVGILPRARGAVGRDQRLRGAAREMKHGSRQLGGKVVVHVSRRNANLLFFPAKDVEAELAVILAIVVERDEKRDP